jgi:hypothetical protein
MTRTFDIRRVLQQPIQLALIAAFVVAGIGYFGALQVMDGRAARYYERLRHDNPQAYLDQLRQGEGFARYVQELSAIEGFDSYRAATPDFLVGRWTMRPALLRLNPGARPDECQDPITFEHGLVLMPRNASGTTEAQVTMLPVQYRLNGETVELQSQGQPLASVQLIGYGAQLDHLEFTPPGRSDTVFAYRCGH